MIIGIDLGTTNSLAAYFTQEGPKSYRTVWDTILRRP